MKYVKMHGAGNEFVLIEAVSSGLPELARRLCSPKTGPGADGLVVLLPAEEPDADFRMLFYNSDGTPGEMCGNAARCVCRFGADRGLAKDPQNIRVETTAGPVTGKKLSEDRYEVRLNDPTCIDLHRAAEAGGKQYDCAYVELGDPGIPHAVLLAPPDGNLGRELRFSPAFPKGANVSFVAVTGANEAEAVTYERGVEGFTKACGTGCGSIAAALTLRGVFTPGEIRIRMPGGELSVRLTNNGGKITDIYLTGPAEYISEGETETFVLV